MLRTETLLAKCLVGLLFLWTQFKESNLFEIESASVCYGNTHSAYRSIQCEGGEVILVRNTRAMAKLASTGCPIEMIPSNENTMPDNCCIYEADDCGTVYTGSVYQSYYQRCHGKPMCPSLQASWVDIADLDCNRTLYLPRTNYMIFTYSCIPTTFIKSPCEGIQTTNSSVFLWNSGYPNEMTPGTDSCACAAEISCNSTIVVTAIDLRFQDSSDTCMQSIVMMEDGDQTIIGCNSNNGFLETTIYTSTSQFITFEISNTLTQNGGHFWIQVSGQDEKSQVTLSCGPSSISQAESTDKPVCGQEDTTSTSTTTTSTTTATASTPTSVSTINTTATTSTTISSTALNTTTAGTTTPILNGTTSPMLNDTTMSMLNGTTTMSMLNGTTTMSMLNGTTTMSMLNGTTTMSMLNGTTSVTTSVNGTDSTTDANTHVNGSTASTTLDPRNSTRSKTNDSTDGTGSTGTGSTSNNAGTGASQQTGGGSGFPIGVLVAVLVVLVIVTIVVVVLICKRKQLKERFCPNKVEDVVDAPETDQAEYATMPNPFMTDSTTLPLITGTAAASTYFPAIPAKRPNQLAPLTTLPPKPKTDIFDLSSSLKYHLPKIEDIRRSMPRQKTSIGAQLVEEHQRNPFPGINRVEPEGAVVNEAVDEQPVETVKERHIRKKKKRMVDRLNRIKTPTHSGRESTFGFSSSAQRF